MSFSNDVTVYVENSKGLTNLDDFEIRDDNVFTITCLKSGKFEEWDTCFSLHSGLVIHMNRCACSRH